jgi:DNA transformation protein
MAVSKEFADYCCDLLAGVGPCIAKRMFGGWGVSVEGMSIAWLLDLGQGEKLWLKSNDALRGHFDAAGCVQFKYEAKGQTRSVNYFAPPDEAMESAPIMLPWARLAMQAALQAHAAKLSKTLKAAKASKASKTSKASAKSSKR